MRSSDRQGFASSTGVRENAVYWAVGTELSVRRHLFPGRSWGTRTGKVLVGDLLSFGALFEKKRTSRAAAQAGSQVAVCRRIIHNVFCFYQICVRLQGHSPSSQDFDDEIKPVLGNLRTSCDQCEVAGLLEAR